MENLYVSRKVCCSSLSAACIKSGGCCEKCIEWYISKSQIDYPDPNTHFFKEAGILDIHNVARFCDNIELFKKVVSFYEDINILTKFGQTPLRFCVSSDKIEFVKFLIEKGANVTHVENNGTTLLHIVRDYEIAKILLDCGAKIHINARACSKATPLFALVSGYDNKDIIQLFLDNGADVDIEADEQMNFHFREIKIKPNIRLLDESRPEYLHLLLKYSKEKEYIPKEKPKFYTSYK